MTQLTRHFSLEELIRSEKADELGISNLPAAPHMANLRVLAIGLETARHILCDRPLHITSGYRCPAVNKAVGGVSSSAHALGWAADFTAAGWETLDAARHLRESSLRFDQLIHEVSRGILHISLDPRMRRQVLTQQAGPRSPVRKGLAGD